jgi:GR25 family glycosyltransferase involved in LPS biosynthesis
MNDNYKIYCLSYNNPVRKLSMKNRFEKLKVNYIFYDGVNFSDPRIHNESYKQCWSCMYGHLDMIKLFYDDPNTNYGIFCEDDIFIHKDFCELIPKIIQDFAYLNLDVLLLGYLLGFKIQKNNQNFILKNNNNNLNSDNYNYLNFPNDIWGTQMYMLSKENAGKLLEKYDHNSNYALKTLVDKSITPFSADWTITKDGNRALLYPCIAVENGDFNISHYGGCFGQYNFHKICHEINYDPNVFI